MNEFKTHQEELRWMANTEAGRFLIGEKTNLPIIQVSPSSHTVFTGEYKKGKPVFRTTAYTYQRNAKILLPILTKHIIINESKYAPVGKSEKYKVFLHNAGLERYNYPRIFLLGGTYYSDPTGSGDVFRSGDATYATAHDSASGTTVESSPNVNMLLANDNSGYLLGRIFLPFDLSAITDQIAISALTLSLYYNSANGRDTTYDDTAQIVQSTQASNTALALSDYSLIGATGGGTSAAWSTWSNAAYTVITGNSTSYSWFTGGSSWFKLGVRATRDISNTTPTQRSYIYIFSPSQTGTDKDPKLDLTYTVVVSGVKNDYALFI